MLETTNARTGGLARGLRTLLLVSALATAAPAIAAEPTAAPAAGAYQPKGGLVLQLGDFEVLALIDREGAYAPNLAQSKQTPAQWERARHLMTPDGKMRAPLGGYLIRSKANNRLVLVDLGLGPYSTPGLPAGDHNMLQELTALGYKPSDITDIVLTHLHLDHIGWASVDGKSTFPNAKYHLPQSEWDYWIAKPEGNSHSKAVLDITQAVMKPVAPQLQAFSGESETLFPGFKIRHAPGHTPGTVIVELDSGGRKALILGDTAHS
ncbi:MAG: MBL fold metallo-hydrolase, partial [Phenylobacterium sp.]